jgi:hypothetical protein
MMASVLNSLNEYMFLLQNTYKFIPHKRNFTHDDDDDDDDHEHDQDHEQDQDEYQARSNASKKFKRVLVKTHEAQQRQAQQRQAQQTQPKEAPQAPKEAPKEAPQTQAIKEAPQAPQAKQTQAKQTAPPRRPTDFIPYQKDKLFWCFFIVLEGFEEYELNRSNWFTIEKEFKIKTAELLKVKHIKEELKSMKIRRSEVENELVMLPCITLQTLHAMCIIYDVAITYVFGRKYIQVGSLVRTPSKNAIILVNEKKQHVLRLNTVEENAVFLKEVRENYWLLEDMEKPLKSVSAYSTNDLQNICKRLQIAVTLDNGKNKTKALMYQDILIKID